MENNKPENIVNFKKIDLQQLEKLKVANGFTRWVRTRDKKSERELRQVLRTRLLDRGEVWVAVTNNTIIGFAILTEWTALPGAKIVDAIEVTKNRREIGVGSGLLNYILQENRDVIIGLLLYPEPGYEKRLTDFYRKAGFEDIGVNGVMIRLPLKSEKLEFWIKYLRDLHGLYEKLLKALRVES